MTYQYPNEDHIDEFDLNEYVIEFSKDYREFEELISEYRNFFVDEEHHRFRESKRDLRRAMSNLDSDLHYIKSVIRSSQNDFKHNLIEEFRDQFEKRSVENLQHLMSEVKETIKELEEEEREDQ